MNNQSSQYTHLQSETSSPTSSTTLSTDSASPPTRPPLASLPISPFANVDISNSSPIFESARSNMLAPSDSPQLDPSEAENISRPVVDLVRMDAGHLPPLVTAFQEDSADATDLILSYPQSQSKERKQTTKKKLAKIATTALKRQDANQNGGDVQRVSKFPKAVKRTIEGTFIKPTSFRFEATAPPTSTALAKSTVKAAPKAKRFAKPKSKPTTTPLTAVTEQTLPITDEQQPIENSTANAVLDDTRKKEPRKTTTKGMRAERISALMEKYLPNIASKAKAQSTAEKNATDCTVTACVIQAPATATDNESPKVTNGFLGLETNQSAFTKLKTIMQVKGEQDRAIRDIQHAPKTFRARPVPLNMIDDKIAKVVVGNIEAVVVDTELEQQKAKVHNTLPSTVPLQPAAAAGSSFKANPIPQSTIEPRYSLNMADKVLKEYSNVAAERTIFSGIAPPSVVDAN